MLNRGYRSGEVELRDYRSLPLQGRARIALEIQASERLDGVPGFYTGSNERGSYPALAGSPGLFIPVRAPNKHIRGLRIRPDNANGAGKYRWLSSADKPGGIGPDASCHISRPLLLPVEDRTVWITEGEIKADLSAERLGAVVVSIPGVDLWSRALPDLAELLPNGGRIVVALDADWRDKPRVHLALSGLLLACTSLGYETGVAL
ncbi:MAG: toprim domain-containing protein [Gemmataceae bacterium]